MYDPYTIDLGEKLYDQLWDDPLRPQDMTVDRWARELIKAHLRTTKGAKPHEDDPKRG